MAVNNSKNKKKYNKSNKQKISISKEILINNDIDKEDNNNLQDNNTENKIEDTILKESINLDSDLIKEDNDITNIEVKIDIDNDIQENINNNIKNNKKSNKIRYIILISLIIFILGIVMFIPRIKIIGDKSMVITYNDNYVESGYKGYVFNKDITNKIKIENNIKEGVIGKYQVTYYYKIMGIKFKKDRKVEVVDNIKPVINIDSNVLNICPNDDIPDIKYEVIDEYDGDITDRLKKTILDDKIILEVKDLSNNKNEEIIKIDRNDREKPVINLKGGNTIYLKYGSKFIEPGYTVEDNCSNNLSDKVEVIGSASDEVGKYNITYKVTDDSGNTNEVIRTVIVSKDYKDNGIVKKGTIYLTFDDGPSSGITERILDILKKEGVKATFFVTSNGPDYLIKRMYDEGHTVGLHTSSHNYSYIYSSTNNYFKDLNMVNDRVKRITGYDSKIIRFPGGSSNTVSRNYKLGIMTELTNLVLNNGYHYFDWNIDAMDASTARTSGDVYYNVTSNLSKNRSNVVLMHDTKDITAGALQNIIRYGKENGYNFDRIDMSTYMIRHGVNN